MSDLKHTYWASVSLNVLLGCLVLYYTSMAAKKHGSGLNEPFLHSSPENSYQNATENFVSYPIDMDNATAVFNGVYGVVKQKDANLNPVGVNFFPAYLPANTPMYHSRRDPNVPESFEWIALDYEFSYSFAHFPRGTSRGGLPKPGGPEKPGKPKPGFPFGRDSRKDPPSEPGLQKRDGPVKEDSASYLFTFRNTRPLDKLIFLDGASAAKSSTGEMDQQLILSQQEEFDSIVRERDAADKICKWGKPFGLQGVVRLEIGFEIILCDFHKDLEIVSNVTLSNVTDMVGFPYERPEPATDLEKSRTELIDRWQAMSSFEWAQAGGNANDGDDRILVDFSHMVTPLNKTWIDPDPYQRRINNIPQILKTQILSELEETLSKGVDPFYQTDWRVVTGRIIEKFSPMLLDFNNTLTIFEHSAGMASDLRAAAESLSTTTFNFVRRYTVSKGTRTQTFQWAIEDYVHNTHKIETASDRLIYSSLYRVTTEIVTTIFELYDLSMAILPDFLVEPSAARYKTHREVLVAKKENLKILLDTLRWSVFTKCSRVCGWDEVCAVPGWGPGPMGWMSGHRNSLHYEDGSYRINSELQCINVKDLRR